MGPAETTGNELETMSETDLALLRIEAHLDRLGAKIDGLDRKADHMDERLHSLIRVVDEHRPLLARAAALADPGAKVRAMLHPRKGKDTRDE